MSLVPFQPPSMAEARGRLRFLAVNLAAWLVVALAWTPPTLMIDRGAGHGLTPGSVFLFVLLGFLPWMATTPLILWIGARFPIGEGRVLRALATQALAGLILLPAIALAGALLTSIAFPGRTHPALVHAATISGFYAVPTYVAVAGIGQAIAYFRTWRTRERLLARAELRALEAQLNPHFLFNALNAVSALGYRDPALADRALTHLAELLRASLTERPQEIALADEVGFIRDYLDLYAIIMPGHVSLSWSVEPAAWRAAVPAMLLQPLIENALVHGLARLPSGGALSLTARRLGDRLQIAIANDAPEAGPAGHGIGLANVRERLRVLHGDRAGLVFRRAARQALVEVELPWREAWR